MCARCAANILAAKEAGAITTPLQPELADQIMQPLLLASQLTQEALHEPCLGIIHKLVLSCKMCDEQT